MPLFAQRPALARTQSTAVAAHAGDCTEKKKRKKKPQPAGGNIRILDEDNTGFRAPGAASALAADDGEEENDEGEWIGILVRSYSCLYCLNMHPCMGMACSCMRTALTGAYLLC